MYTVQIFILEFSLFLISRTKLHVLHCVLTNLYTFCYMFPVHVWTAGFKGTTRTGVASSTGMVLTDVPHWK